jgi:hypothetical protein
VSTQPNPNTPVIDHEFLNSLEPSTRTDPYADVPQQMKDLPNWVVWKDDKIPYDPKTNQPADANDPSTWGTFEQAVDAAIDGAYRGIGFEFGNSPYEGIDFDGLLGGDRAADPYARAILAVAKNPYCEVSPSKTGLHSVVEGQLPAGAGHKFMLGEHRGIEIYDTKRYFTVTGDHFSGKGIPKVDSDLIYFLVSQFKNQKFKHLWLGEWQNVKDAKGRQIYPSQSEAVLALCSLLVKGGFNTSEKLDAAFRLSGLVPDEWDRTSKYTIPTALSGKEAASSTNSKPTAAIEFHTSARPDPDGDYVIAPSEGEEDGWFPLGDISLIGGASGTGKTTWIFDTLYKQKQGYAVLGHRTFGRTFHVLAYDRRRNANARTMRRMKLLPSDIPMTKPRRAFGVAAVQGIINEIEKMDPTPGIVFIEGLDMLIDDSNKKSVVSPFMDYLQEVAEHFHIAIIGSVGAPKAKRGEEYAAKRDKLSGSEAWGRSSETVCVLEYAEDDDGTTPQRSLTILPRNAGAEKFVMEFQSGRLVPVQPTAGVDPEPEVNPVGRPNLATQKAIKFLEKELQDGRPKIRAELCKKAKELEEIGQHAMDNAAAALHVVRIDYQDITLKNRPWRQRWSILPMHAVGGSDQEGSQSSLIDYGDTQKGRSA